MFFYLSIEDYSRAWLVVVGVFFSVLIYAGDDNGADYYHFRGYAFLVVS